MAVLYISFTDGKDIVRSLNSSRRELNDILRKLKNADSNLNGIGKKSSYIDRCKEKIQEEKRRVQSEIDNIDSFTKRLDKFLDYARDRDRNCGKTIGKEGYQYRKNTGLLHDEIMNDLKILGGILVIGGTIIAACFFPVLVPVAVGATLGGAFGAATGGANGFLTEVL